MKLNNSNRLIVTIAIAAALITACSGGGDATAPDDTPTPTPTPSGTPSPTPTPSAEPTTGYGYVTNPAGGNYGNQCAKDFATGLIWEGKNPNPAHQQGIGRTYTNYDSTAALQYEILILGRPSVFVAPTISQINDASNSIGYKNTINAIALCGFSDWRLPTRDELIALGQLSSKLADFPETSSVTYWSNDTADRDSTGVVVRPPATSGNKESRGNSFGLRLVRSSR